MLGVRKSGETVNISETEAKAISMLKNARNILKDGGYFYAKEIDKFLETIPCQAAEDIGSAEGVETRR
jgi:hypothetical protein